MKSSFWIKRFLVVFLGAFALLLVVGLLKNRPVERVVAESAIWAGASAIIFVLTRLYQSRRGQHCALCQDTPETAELAKRSAGQRK